jgi:eukaryotic translation initiation factor 2C
MRFAQDVRICTKSKTETIDGALLSSLVESLLIQFFVNNDGTYPSRILVYRDGVNDGCFNRVRKYEIQSIRQGYRNFVNAHRGSYPDCTNDCKSGCVFCCPPITLIACMTRTNVKIVPADPREGNKNNVWSGTCVDEALMDKIDNLKLDDCPIEGKRKNFEPRLYSEPGGGGYDFLLTAQGGLKGTSKPVHYRIIWNENAVHGVTGGSCLSKDMLELATYQMSFQYSTATKVRNIQSLAKLLLNISQKS